MVSIRKPTQKRSLVSGWNIFIFLLGCQVIAVVFFASHGSAPPPLKSHTAYSVTPQQAGLKAQLDTSMQALKKIPAKVVRPAPLVANQVQETDSAEDDAADDAAADGDGDADQEDETAEDEAAEDEAADGDEAAEGAAVQKSGGGQQEVEIPRGGTHAASNYYFADYSYERENPSFRHESVADWDESHDKIVAQLPNVSVRSCQYKSDDHSLLFSHKCRQADTKLIAYNAAHFERTWCDVNIPPGKAMEISKNCLTPVRLFPKDTTPVNGEGMPPIVVSSAPEVKGKLKSITCDIPCQFEFELNGEERYVQGTDWKIFQSMGDPVKVDNAKVERTGFRQDIYYSTTSLKSSVPLSFFSFDKYNIFNPPVDFDKVKASGSYFPDVQCVSHYTKRNRWAEAVKDAFPVANYGKCAHDTDVPDGINLRKPEDRIKLLKEHRFNLAFEFGDAKDHITPVVWEAFDSGTLPVVLGANNVRDHFPPNSFLAASGFSKWAELGAEVARVAADKKEWEKFHAYRTDPKAKQAFEEMYNFTRTGPECRMCRWAYAKRYGMGWVHNHQYVRETTIDRTLCIFEKEKLISKPFTESWHELSKGKYSPILASDGGKSTCAATVSTLSNPTDLKLKRDVFMHDNIVDFELSSFVKEAPDGDIVLRLDFPVRNAEGSYFPNPHTLVATIRGAAASSLAIQDSKSKVIVLASWQTQLTSAREGLVEVIIRKSGEVLLHEEDETRRIRIVIEDMVQQYDKATEFYPTSFAKQMIQDFVDPLELFYVDP